jgi:hypothetical protein
MDENKKQRVSHLRKHSKTADLLEELVDNLDLLFTFGYRPQAVMKYGIDGVRRMQHARARDAKRRAMKRLQERRLLEIEDREGALYVALTAEGAKEYLRLKVLDADLYEDDRECLVVFDIPETKRKVRKMLREFLSEVGFIPIQRSVWISKFQVGQSLREMFAANNSLQWMRIFEVQEV